MNTDQEQCLHREVNAHTVDYIQNLFEKCFVMRNDGLSMYVWIMYV